MCGFVGHINFLENIQNSEIVKMNNLLEHRGPDSEGYNYFSLENNKIYDYFDNNNKIIGEVGFKRLSILDKSSLANQPYLSSNKKVSLIFNGEIYNYKLLKKILIDKGYSFKTSSDTEVIINYYLCYGINKLLSDLDGMFTLFIFDLENKVSYLARDRLGIKPIYYYYDQSNFIFASETKSLLQHSKVEIKVDNKAILEFLIFDNLHGNKTFFDKIKILQPGKYIEIKNNISIYTYYSISDVIKNKKTKSNPHIISKLIEESTKLQLVSDVPVATQLSGGLDSSIISYFLSQHTKRKIESVSIIFNEDLEYSENQFINYISDLLKINNHSTNMNLKIFNQNLEKCIFHYDFPFATANSVGIYELCKMAKKKYTVLLSGEGADELFFGYDRYFRYVLISYFINIIPSKKLQLKFIKYNILKNTNYYFIKKLINNNIINFTSTIDVNAIINDRISFFFNNNLRFIENFQIYEIRTHLHELLLRQDKMSMASSVENRVPFLSNNILDYALTLDLRFKMLFTIFKSMRTKLSKIVLKNFALKLFKREFVLRKKKWLFRSFA